MMGKPYDIGYGKPPVATRFQSGKIYNPDGRRGKNGTATRKSTKTMLAETVEAELRSTISVTENGRQRTLKKMEVWIKKLVNDAIAGKHSAQGELRQLLIAFPEIIERVVRPSGRVVFAYQGADPDAVRKIKLGQIQKAFPDMPESDLLVFQKYFRRWAEGDDPLDR